jgi:hypothetical protein
MGLSSEKLLIEAPVNGGRNYNGPVSSDLHEWRNDGHAVSTQDSVKLKSLLRCSVPAARRKDPVNLYYSFTLDFDLTCVG